MISYRLSDDHEELRATVAGFARDVVAPVIGGYYERGEFPYDIVARMGKLGLFGLPFPEEYGGMGGDYFALCLALEELARVDSSVAITLEAGGGARAPCRSTGSAPPEQRRQWLPDLCSGERLAAFGLTEPGGGSDIPGGMRTTARLEKGDGEAGGEWVINGSQGVHHQLRHRHHLAGDRAGDHRPRRRTGERPEISSIIVPAGTPGFTVGPEYSKVGWCASDTRELSFADCRVPAGNLLGERGRGYAQFLQILDEGRIAIAALATGLAAGLRGRVPALRRRAGGVRPPARALPGDPVQDRRHGGAGRTPPGWPGTTRPPGWSAGEPVKKEAAIAKLTASNAAMDNARDATQIFGGYGFMNEYPVARFYRDAKVLEIGEGTSEVQRMIIARELRPRGDRLTGHPARDGQ